MYELAKFKAVVAIAVTVILVLGLSAAVISSSAASNTRVAAGGMAMRGILILHKV